MSEKQESRYIVRITGKDLDGNKPIYVSLMNLKGMNHRLAKVVAKEFEKETGVKFDSKIGLMPENKDKILEEIVTNPKAHNVPNWMLNRRKNPATGEDTHKVMGELDFQLREDLKRLNIIKSYRGLRHSWHLPVRGQRTKTNNRTIRGNVRKTMGSGRKPSATPT